MATSRKSRGRSSRREKAAVSAGRKRAVKSSAKKSASRVTSRRGKKARTRKVSPVERVKRVAGGVVHQAAGIGGRAVDTVTEFVHHRF